MNDVEQNLNEFIREFSCDDKLPPKKSDLFKSTKIDGDDAFEFIDEFANRFNVDMSNYNWYFHHGEEGHNIGGIFFKPPYERVTHIPITIEVLENAIAARRWPITYPDHTLPAVRWDIHFNLAFLVVSVVLFFSWLIMRIF